MAARHLDKNLVTIPCPGFADVFEGVEKGYLDLGIVPVENSLGGAVTQVNESLLKTDLKVVSAVVFQIKHCLLILPNTNYREIRMVYSHPQALSQCREFLQRQNLEARPYYDTAGAAKMLFKEKPRMAGTIASKLAAELYNLDVIKENVEDNPMNFTRFLILSKEEKKQNANKCSIVFATPHKSGSLFAVLKIFKEARINLTRIESLPHREAPGNYVFFLDFQSKDLTSGISDVLSEVKKNTKMFKYLGCYKEEISQ
jgi:prephenate dehydratase/chorismate mutase/prephenate dehydratase